MHLDTAFTPLTLGNLELKNRFIKTATYEGFCRDGIPLDKLYELHAAMAEADVALTTVAYGAVNADGLTHENQMVIDDETFPYWEEMASAVHKKGGRISVQLTHCGFFTKSTRYTSKRPLAPSKVINKYGLLRGRGFAREMTVDEIHKTVKDFGRSARIVKDTGFDAVEVHMGHGYLLSQFLSPVFNKRKDDYGGSPGNRLKFPLEIIREIRNNTGESYPILVKMNLSDGLKGGLDIEESIHIAKALEEAGVNALILSGGITSRTPFYLMRGDVPLWDMVKAEENILQKITMALFGKVIIRKYKFEENFFLPLALKVRKEVKLPLVYVGGVISGEGIARIMESGFDLIALGRALIYDPDFLKKIRKDPSHRSECNQCNVCVAEIEAGGLRCVLNSKQP